MEQRRLRLGDILDDYCPRERRVTNHAVVAMIEEDIKQTRCTTCDAEHAYKGARTPKRRKKETPAGALALVVAGSAQLPPDAMPVVESVIESLAAEMTMIDNPHDEDEPLAALDDVRDEVRDEPQDDPVEPEEEIAPVIEEGPAHRRLIRATLPRPEGQKTERQVPEFTVRHGNNGRPNNNFRGGDRMKARGQGGNGNGSGFGNGNRASGAPRFGRGGQPRSGGQNAGFRGGQQRQGGGRKGRGSR
jgi:hypothetical protein